MYGKLMRIPDTVMPVYYDLLLDEPLNHSLSARDAKRRLAYAITERYQGADAARAAQERFDTVHVRRELPTRSRNTRIRRRQRVGARAGPAGGRVRAVALRGPAAAGPGRR